MTGTDDSKDFNRSLVISFGCHVLIFFLSLATGKLISTIFKSNDVEIIRSSVRVDVVGMPKFTIQELRDMQKVADLPKVEEKAPGVKDETVVKTEAEDVIKKDDIVIQEEGKKKKASFLNLLSDYSNKKVTAKEQPKGKKNGTDRKNLDSLIVEGNRLSQGSALVGDYSDQATSELGAYVQVLPDLIRRNWKLPSYLMDKNLRCRIKIYLSGSGQLLKMEINESSGEDGFDDRAKAAIQASSPFPKPSAAVTLRLTNSGIILGFPL